jgi:hypothetical protein
MCFFKCKYYLENFRILLTLYYMLFLTLYNLPIFRKLFYFIVYSPIFNLATRLSMFHIFCSVCRALVPLFVYKRTCLYLHFYYLEIMMNYRMGTNGERRAERANFLHIGLRIFPTYVTFHVYSSDISESCGSSPISCDLISCIARKL